MQSQQSRTLGALQRVQHFLDTNAATIPPATYVKPRALLDDAVGKLEAHAVQQGTARLQSKGEVVNLRQLKVVLRTQHMAPIAKIARALLPNVPDFAAFRMANSHQALPKLLAAAGAMGKAAAEHVAVFTDHGLAPDFLAQLQQATDAVQQSQAAARTKRGQIMGATTGVSGELRRAKRAVLLIDAVIGKSLVGNPSLQAEWASTKAAVQAGNQAATARPTSNPVSAGVAATAAPVAAPVSGSSPPAA